MFFALTLDLNVPKFLFLLLRNYITTPSMKDMMQKTGFLPLNISVELAVLMGYEEVYISQNIS